MLKGFHTRLLTLVAVVVLVVPGCARTFVPSEGEGPQLHPEIPQPLSLSPVDWQVYDVDGRVVIGATKGEFSSHMENMNELLRFIRELRQSLCYYRQDLGEDFCKEEK